LKISQQRRAIGSAVFFDSISHAIPSMVTHHSAKEPLGFVTGILCEWRPSATAVEPEPRHWRLERSNGEEALRLFQRRRLDEDPAKAVANANHSGPTIARSCDREEVFEVGVEALSEIHVSRALIAPSVIGDDGMAIESHEGTAKGCTTVK